MLYQIISSVDAHNDTKRTVRKASANSLKEAVEIFLSQRRIQGTTRIDMYVYVEKRDTFAHVMGGNVSDDNASLN